MARRVICILIAICIIAAFTACQKKEDGVNPVNFYYLSPVIEYHHPEGMIKPERREILNEGNDLSKIRKNKLTEREKEPVFVSKTSSLEFLTI